ncbi:MAG: hypothetical protein GEV07_23235 [Streptosporangiales bacterium]|nr:hypothetical protein [Streptosporangiales bacterium]
MTDRVRLATVQLRGLLRGGADVAASLGALDADVVCVQGTPRWVRWRTRCAALARRAGLVYVTGGGSASGTMLLCSPRAFVAHREDFPLPGIAQPAGRSLAIAVFSFTGGQQLVVGSVRLGRAAGERLRHLDLIARRLVSLGRKYSAPYALAGDLHEPAAGRAGATWPPCSPAAANRSRRVAGPASRAPPASSPAPRSGPAQAPRRTVCGRP